MQIEVAYAEPEQQWLEQLDLPDQATVAEALAVVARHSSFPAFDLEQISVGVFGRVCALERVLQTGDRLEIYRPLLVDAKTARLQRAKQQQLSS